MSKPLVPTKRACEAASLMGASIPQVDARAEPAPLPAGEQWLASPLTLVTGPSGAGKTTILAHAKKLFTDRGIRVIDPAALRPSDKPAVDLLSKNAHDAMRALAAVGLAELRCFVRRERELSTGQRARLRLALALDRAPESRPAAILIDEFASSLDDLTARSHARLVRRLVAKNPGLRFVLATNRADLARHLAPNLWIETDLAGVVTVRSAKAASLDFCDITEGRRADLKSLAPFHYRSGMPATIERVLRAVDRETGTLAGVLATSRPTLNGCWRASAFPGLFDSGDKAADARAINEKLRTISRVIIDPRFRGLGLAKALVRHELRNPDTPCTEAVAAMGAVCPFFRAAGMAQHTLDPSPRDARLAAFLSDAGVEPWRLATPASALARAGRATSGEELHHELRAWARSSGSTSKLVDAPIEKLFERATRSLASPLIAYSHQTR